jgi:hypothetical protein
MKRDEGLGSGERRRGRDHENALAGGEREVGQEAPLRHEKRKQSCKEDREDREGEWEIRRPSPPYERPASLCSIVTLLAPSAFSSTARKLER